MIVVQKKAMCQWKRLESQLRLRGTEIEFHRPRKAGQSKTEALLRGTERKFEWPRKGQSKRLCCELPKGNLTVIAKTGPEQIGSNRSFDCEVPKGNLEGQEMA